MPFPSRPKPRPFQVESLEGRVLLTGQSLPSAYQQRLILERATHVKPAPQTPPPPPVDTSPTITDQGAFAVKTAVKSYKLTHSPDVQKVGVNYAKLVVAHDTRKVGLAYFRAAIRGNGKTINQLGHTQVVRKVADSFSQLSHSRGVKYVGDTFSRFGKSVSTQFNKLFLNH